VNIFRKFVSEYSQVVKAADRQTQRVYNKFGAFARRTAKGLIRKFKKPSKPGRPPHSHGRELLKKFIFFTWDPTARSELIGAAKLNGTIGDAPSALEHGGKSRARVGRKGHKHVETVTIAARPYIGPAVTKELPKLPGLWSSTRPGV